MPRKGCHCDEDPGEVVRSERQMVLLYLLGIAADVWAIWRAVESLIDAARRQGAAELAGDLEALEAESRPAVDLDRLAERLDDHA